MSNRSFINEKGILAEASKQESRSLLYGFQKKYHSLDRSLRTLIDSISNTSPNKNSFQNLSRSRVVALIQNISHEISQLQPKPKEDARNPISYNVELGAKFQSISYETERMTLVASQLVFQTCWNEINEARSGKMGQTCDDDNDDIGSSNILASSMEFLSLVFRSFDYNVVYEILQRPILFQKGLIMPLDLLSSIITSDSTTIESKEMSVTTKKGITRNQCQPSKTSCLWMSSKIKSHAMLIIFRGLRAAEFIHRHIKSSHIEFPDHPTNSSLGDCMGIYPEPENMSNILNHVSYFAIEFLSQGEEGWVSDNFINGFSLAFEALGFLCTSIRCSFDSWINVYNNNRDSQNLDQKQRMKIFDRLVLVLLRYSTRCGLKIRKQPDIPKERRYISIELASFSLLLLMEWRSHGTIDIIQQESQIQKTEIINNILERILSHCTVSESEEEICHHNILLQTLFDLSWTKNEILLRSYESEVTRNKIKHYVSFILSQMPSKEIDSDCHCRFFLFIQTMHLSYQNRFRKILFLSIQEIERNQSELRLENSDDETFSNVDKESDGFGSKTIIPYLSRVVLDQQFSSTILGICLWRMLLFGQFNSYRNDTLSISLWETIEAPSHSKYASDIFYKLVGLISTSEMLSDCNHRGFKKILNFSNLPVLCAIGDLLSLFFSSKKCCSQLIKSLAQKDEGIELIKTIGSVFKITSTWCDVTREKEKLAFSSEYKSQPSSLVSTFTVGESTSSSSAHREGTLSQISHVPICATINSNFEPLQCTFTLISATILGRIVNCGMNTNTIMSGMSGSLDQSKDCSFSQIKRSSHHLLREFVTCGTDNQCAGSEQISIIESALSQIRSRDIPRRAILLQNMLFCVYDEEFNIGDNIFETNSMLARTIKSNDQEIESLRNKYYIVNEKQRKLERDSIVAKSTYEKEKTRALAHARFDAMELVEAHSEARKNSEQTALYYKEKVSAAELEIQKITNAMNESLREANAYNKKIRDLEKELSTKQDRINCMEVHMKKNAEDISQSRSEINTLLERVTASEDAHSNLHQKNSELQHENELLHETKENSFFKLIALAQAYEQKEYETTNARDELLNELKNANEETQTFQKKYEKMKKKACEFMDENDALRRKLEKTLKKLEEASQRRPVGPVSYMNSLHDESHVQKKSQRSNLNDISMAGRKLQRNGLYDESRVEKSYRFSSQHNSGKENDASIVSSRRTKEGRKSNWKIVK